MKKIVLMIFLSIITTTAYSQEVAQETLFGSQDLSFGGYGGPEVKFTNFNDEFGVQVGGRGGLLVNSVFTLGIAGYGVVSSHSVDNYYAEATPWHPADSNVYLRMGYGGLHLGFIIEPNKLIHITAGVLIGAGGAVYTSAICLDEDNFDDDYHHDHRTYERSAFFIAEPQVGAEINLLKFMRMEISASYRFVSGLDLPNTKNSDLNGFSGGLMFKFGKF